MRPILAVFIVVIMLASALVAVALLLFQLGLFG